MPRPVDAAKFLAREQEARADSSAAEAASLGKGGNRRRAACSRASDGHGLPDGA